MRFAFRCPKCDAEPHEHGKGGAERCIDPGSETCEGLICECDPSELPRSEEPGHGEALDNPCTEAHCYHCGWGGTHPKAPKGLQAWERKALEAGWTMPAARAEELKG